ncbi:Rieske (2Fe-2S) protein [Occultella kanbiaonis]|uniref:Rieske (2Fe-2S) protein n=1 Tax=Occultella kanbiaonis TaxID=2675754 RepID=UPI0012B996C2|nr:Rieske (2Fe-2S) protein [Occultella kanbiaonis]
MSNHVSRRLMLGAGVVLAAASAGYVVARNVSLAERLADTRYPLPGEPSSEVGDSTDPGAVLLAVDEIPDGGGVVLAEQQLVLTRSGDTVHGFSAVCTHQGCLVDAVRDGSIVCPCHGSHFDAETGAVLTGPASQPLPDVAVTVTDGEVRLG